MSEGNPLAQMPPWGWGLLLLGSGGGIGTLGGLNMGDHETCADKQELLKSQSDLESARNAIEAGNATIQSLIEVIKTKNNGWIE